MKKYQVLVEGRNVWMDINGERKNGGFYTCRFVEEKNEKDAANAAIELVKNALRSRDDIVNTKSDPPLLQADEIEELESFDNIESLEPAFIFHDEDKRDKH